VQDSNLRRI